MTRGESIRVGLCATLFAGLVSVAIVSGSRAQSVATNASDVSSTSPFPVGDKHVQSIQLLKIPGATSGGVASAIAVDKYIYLAGKAWNQEDNERLWLWRVEGSGQVIWEKQLARQERNEELRIVGLAQGASLFSNAPPNVGVRVVYRQGGETRLSFFNAGGKSTIEQTVGQLEDTRSLVPIDENDTLLLGTTMTVNDQPSHA